MIIIRDAFKFGAVSGTRAANPMADVLKMSSISGREKGWLSFETVKSGEAEVVIASFHIGSAKVETEDSPEERHIPVIELFLEVFGGRGDNNLLVAQNRGNEVCK